MNFEWPHTNLKWLRTSTIYLTKHGSHAYGTNIPGSDLDIRGIAVAPRRYYVGFSQRFEQAEYVDPDMVIFDIQKFFRLCANCNPNCLEILYTDSKDHLAVCSYGQMILEKRDLFLSKRAAKTFVGYAHGQIRRLQNKLSPDGTYDGKHAMHIVRLLREGKELLETGTVNVLRSDREELLEIRDGKWTIEDLLAYAVEATADLDRATLKSPLPEIPDIEKLDTLCCRIIESYQGYD